MTVPYGRALWPLKNRGSIPLTRSNISGLLLYCIFYPAYG